jgi:hypothetical protein
MNWKIALALSTLALPALALLPAATGCIGDECSQADDHVAECQDSIQVDSPSNGLSMTEGCGGTRLCQARCINKSSCTDINAAECVGVVACIDLDGGLSEFETCMNACMGASQ